MSANMDKVPRTSIGLSVFRGRAVVKLITLWRRDGISVGR